MLLEAKLAKKVSVIAHTDSTDGKSMATRSGTVKKTKHVELRFLYAQNLVQMGLLRMAKIDGTRNPADLMTKYAATDVLQRLKTQLGMVSNWFQNNADADAHDLDDHVAALNAQCPPRPLTSPHWEWPPGRPSRSCPRTCHHWDCMRCTQCISGRHWTEVHVEGLCELQLRLQCCMFFSECMSHVNADCCCAV